MGSYQLSSCPDPDSESEQDRGETFNVSVFEKVKSTFLPQLPHDTVLQKPSQLSVLLLFQSFLCAVLTTESLP